jgi:hypothetical protein
MEVCGDNTKKVHRTRKVEGKKGKFVPVLNKLSITT